MLGRFLPYPDRIRQRSSLAIYPGVSGAHVAGCDVQRRYDPLQVAAKRGTFCIRLTPKTMEVVPGVNGPNGCTAIRLSYGIV
jgi:hypothetical protein